MSSESKIVTSSQANVSAAQAVGLQAQQKKAVGVIQNMEAQEPDAEQQIALIQRQENKTGMPDQLKSGVESLSGMSMDHVKVHYNSSQPAQLNALAYAQGSDIHIGPGQEKHLPHEAWHVVQQAQGRVQATAQMKTGVPVNDDPELEHEADVMGDAALQNGNNLQLKGTINDVPRNNSTTYSLKERAIPGVLSTTPIAQRKIAVAKDNKEDENDWVILTNLQYAKTLVGGDVVDFGAGSDYSNMGESESLAIVGHGAPGKIQGFDASSIVAALTKKDKAMPKTTRKLILLCCNAAAPTEADDLATSLAGQLAFLLREAGYGTIVEGKPSLTQISPETGINATKPSEINKHLVIEKKIINEHELNFTKVPDALRPERIEWFKSKGVDMSKLDKPGYQKMLKWLAEKNIRKFASEILAEQGYDPSGMNLEQKAELVAKITGPFYKQLAKETDDAGTLFKEGVSSGSGTVLFHGSSSLEL